MFPYEKQFCTYAKQKKKLAASTITLAAKSISTFWNYYSASLSTEADIQNVNASDIRNFLDSLESNLNMKSRTVNKYLSHLKMYFIFLNEYGYISAYPLLTMRGNRFSRKQQYTINWMPYLPQLCKISEIYPETIKMMSAIACGFKPDEIVNLHVNSLLNKIENTELKQYLMNQTDFTQNDNPYLFARKNGEHYASDFNINQKIAPNRAIIGMQLTSHKLRMSYIYSILSDHQLSDEEILKTLRINLKSLNYYRKNLMLYVETHDFKMSE